MKLNVKALAITSGALWGGAILASGLANLIWPSYANTFLNVVDSIYPGYHSGEGVGSVIVGTLYAILDGGVGGALFAWIYNKLTP